MLWVDQVFISSTDLNSLDGEASDVATAANITLTGQNGLIVRSIELCGRELYQRMVGFAGFLAGDSLSANHLQAVFNIGTPAVQRTRILLDNVIVTGQNSYTFSEIKNWVVYRTLQELYRVAAVRYEEDRYEKKRDHYQFIARWEAWPQVTRIGLPVIYKPMQAPAAYFGHNSGSWTATEVAGTATGGNWDVALTYYDSSQTINPESNPSTIQTFTTTSNQVLKIDITKLNPPNGQGNPIDVSQAIITPLNATHWSIYAGPTGSALTLQQSLIPISTKTFTLPGDPTSSGVVAGLGQFPNQRLTILDTIQRA